MQPALEKAASLAFALLRFETAASGGAFATERPGNTLGKDAFIFLPVMRRVMSADVARYLASLPSPAILIPSSARGMIAVLLLAELSGERREWGDRLLGQYRDGLESAAKRLHLEQASPVVLEFDDEAHVFDFATLGLCCERFLVQVAFNLDPMLYDDPRAKLRLNVIRSDGTRSWGATCPVRLAVDDSPDAA